MTESTTQPTPAPVPASTPRPVWQIILISTVVSTVVSITTVFAYTKLKPEPEPTVTEQILDGIGDLFGAVGEIDAETLEMMAQMGSLFGGGGSMGDFEQVMQMAEMALGGADMLEGLTPNDGFGGLGGLGDLGSLGDLGDFDKLFEDSLGQMEEALMEGLQSGIGDMLGSLGELEEGLGGLDLSGLLGGAEDSPSIEGWEASPGDDGFDGLEALDRLLEGQ